MKEGASHHAWRAEGVSRQISVTQDATFRAKYAVGALEEMQSSIAPETLLLPGTLLLPETLLLPAETGVQNNCPGTRCGFLNRR
jgi:hypothetical protein